MNMVLINHNLKSVQDEHICYYIATHDDIVELHEIVRAQYVHPKSEGQATIAVVEDRVVEQIKEHELNDCINPHLTNLYRANKIVETIRECAAIKDNVLLDAVRGMSISDLQKKYGWSKENITHRLKNSGLI